MHADMNVVLNKYSLTRAWKNLSLLVSRFRLNRAIYTKNKKHPFLFILSLANAMAYLMQAFGLAGCAQQTHHAFSVKKIPLLYSTPAANDRYCPLSG